jgi:hypothetical protein
LAELQESGCSNGKPWLRARWHWLQRSGQEFYSDARFANPKIIVVMTFSAGTTLRG